MQKKLFLSEIKIYSHENLSIFFNNPYIQPVLPSCISMKKFTSLKDELNNASKQNELLRQENLRLQTAATEMESANRQFNERNRNLTARLDEALYDLNAQKQKTASFERTIDQLNRQMESLKKAVLQKLKTCWKSCILPGSI
jgi:DNA anti-recombination protein RmuC